MPVRRLESRPMPRRRRSARRRATSLPSELDCWPRPTPRPRRLLEDGRARLAQELVELDARADADIVAAAGRSGDELRAEIARLSAAAVEHVVTGSLDAATHQELIENFIAKVGAGVSA